MSIREIPLKLSDELKNHITDTRLLAFNKLIQSKKLPKRRKEVAEALMCALEPMTSSMLELWASKQDKFKHLRRCTITGRFNELEKANIIREFKIGTCEVTGSTAKFYTVVECL